MTNSTTNKTEINDIILDLKYSDWRSFTIDNTMYFIKSNFKSESYSIIVTDLIMVWYKHSNEKKTNRDKQDINMTKRFNSHLDSPTETILSILQETLCVNEKKHETLFKVSCNSCYELSLSLSMKISFYTFKWIFECDPLEKNTITNIESRKSHSEFIRDHLLLPLLFINKSCLDQLTKLTNHCTNLEKMLNTSISQQQQQQQDNRSTSVPSLLVGDKKRQLTIAAATINNSSSQSSLAFMGAKSSTVPQLLTRQDVDFNDKNFNLIGNDPIFKKYVDHLNIIEETNNNTTVITNYDEYDSDDEEISKPFTMPSSTSNNTTITSNNTELNLYYDETPKKPNNNKRKSNTVKLNSLPSSINFSSSLTDSTSSSSLSLSLSNSFGLSQGDDYLYDGGGPSSSQSNINHSTNSDNTTGDEMQEYKRRQEIQDQIESSKNKQKKKKPKFV
ncbi:hypothetical protein CYY_005060 [Polysphondylium violaceum]|uniref:Non-homologous end-joining factor 1 n=1 Tax=Polysphondylium violaceum TaxID=133409 RepID=A0A8J4PUE2_9MYCE|nr:hypothetical protein CYY_005060 [Polysphondylium violaceum]